ncbi:MAG: hypothetical protein LBB80_05815, partial [Treponema sp.]|nr:hypothetical protein [Treponema sp.]
TGSYRFVDVPPDGNQYQYKFVVVRDTEFENKPDKYGVSNETTVQPQFISINSVYASTPDFAIKNTLLLNFSASNYKGAPITVRYKLSSPTTTWGAGVPGIIRDDGSYSLGSLTPGVSYDIQVKATGWNDTDYVNVSLLYGTTPN